MEAYRTEEEQLEALRNWWKENGRNTIITIVISVAAVFGWQGWQEQQRTSAEAASLLYQNLLQANQGVRAGATAEQLATANHLAAQLREQHSNSLYGQFAALYSARYAMIADDYAAAEAALQSVIESADEPDLRDLATLRLARVVAAQGDRERALSLLATPSSLAFAPAYAEAEGDIYYANGDQQQAAVAYRKALELSAEQDMPAGSGLLQLKADDLNATQSHSDSPSTSQQEG